MGVCGKVFNRREEVRGTAYEKLALSLDEYPTIVTRMKEVFGESRVDAGFAPLASVPAGVETIRAGEKLDQVKSALKSLDLSEGNWKATDSGGQQAKLIKFAVKRRLAHRDALLANVYLHYVLNQWFEQQVKPRLQGQARIIRYADDFVCTFERKSDAERFAEVLVKRLARYSLRLPRLRRS